MAPWYLASDMIKGIPITRYIASWYIAGGTQSIHRVREWLKTLIIDGEHLSDDEIDLIAECTVTGKLELEGSAKRFLSN